MLMNQEYVIENRWNESGQNWEINIYNLEMKPIVTSLPLVCGVNLLKGHQHLLPAKLICYTSGDSNAIPTFNNLGSEANVYFVGSI